MKGQKPISVEKGCYLLALALESSFQEHLDKIRPVSFLCRDPFQHPRRESGDEFSGPYASVKLVNLTAVMGVLSLCAQTFLWITAHWGLAHIEMQLGIRWFARSGISATPELPHTPADRRD